MARSQTPKKVVVSKAAVKKAGTRSTRASAKLEGRVVPARLRRSDAVAGLPCQAAATALISEQKAANLQI